MQAFVWFSASHLSSATIYVIWKVLRGFLFGVPPGHVSRGCLAVLWMVFRWLFCYVYLFIVFGYCHVAFLTLPVYRISSVSILSYCYPLPCATLPVACEEYPVEMRLPRSRSGLSSRMSVMEIKTKVIFQREHSYRDLCIHLVGIRLWRSRRKFSSSGNNVTEIWMKVFVLCELHFGDLDQSLRPAETKLPRLEFWL